MKKITFFALSAASVLIAVSCADRTGGTIMDIGQGFESHMLQAPWDGLQDDTRFCCHRAGEKFFFSYEVSDTTLTLTEPFTGERDVDPEDRVEFFFSSADDMSEGYYCAEIDPLGHVMDYHAKLVRDFDFSWNYETLEVSTMLTPWGYRVGGSIDVSELESLGLDLEEGFSFGVFRADFTRKDSVNWYSLVPTDDVSADFHKPDVLCRCRMTPKEERLGVVVYPGDISSVGLEEWEKRIRLSGINLIGIHAATVNDPLDSLESFIKSDLGQDFLKLCSKMEVDVEYELHALQNMLPRELFDTHPEYFREDEDGLRCRPYNMCFTSDEAVESMRPQVEALLGWMKPTTHRYFIWTDDKQGKFCHCEHCREFTPSEQALIYENKLLKMLREYDPEATLAHLAYHQTMEAPVKVRAAEGIFLEFAPILRDYSLPLPEETEAALSADLLAFPSYSQHVLEYWLDESMFSNWKRDSLVQMSFDPVVCGRDIKKYRSLGAADITCFATWLNADYIEQFGPTDDIFSGYGTCR